MDSKKPTVGSIHVRQSTLPANGLRLTSISIQSVRNYTSFYLFFHLTSLIDNSFPPKFFLFYVFIFSVGITSSRWTLDSSSSSIPDSIRQKKTKRAADPKEVPASPSLSPAFLVIYCFAFICFGCTIFYLEWLRKAVQSPTTSTNTATPLSDSALPLTVLSYVNHPNPSISSDDAVTPFFSFFFLLFS